MMNSYLGVEHASSGSSLFVEPQMDGMGFDGDKIQSKDDDRRVNKEDEEAKDIKGSRPLMKQANPNKQVKGAAVREDMRGGMSERGA